MTEALIYALVVFPLVSLVLHAVMGYIARKRVEPTTYQKCLAVHMRGADWRK